MQKYITHIVILFSLFIHDFLIFQDLSNDPVHRLADAAQ